MKDPDLITSNRLGIQAGDVVILGAPWEEGSSYSRGTAQAPARIREALFSPARSLVTESGLDLEEITRIHWLGDLELPVSDRSLTLLEEATDKILAVGARLLTWGGDHSITPAAVRAFARRFSRLTLVQIDAHPDLYDEYQSDRFSHACAMTRIMEEKQVDRLIQLGIRAATPPQMAQIERFAAEVVEPVDWSAAGIRRLGIEDPIYISLDLDGLDPAFAPGVSHPEPGGLSTRQLIEIIQTLPGPVVGADVVELNPLRDLQGLTALAAAKLTKELVARLLEDSLE